MLSACAPGMIRAHLSRHAAFVTPYNEQGSSSNKQRVKCRLLWVDIREQFEKFVDSSYYYESELCGGAVTVSFSKHLSWQAMHFLQRSTHFSKMCCRPFAASFRKSLEGSPFSWLQKPRNLMGQDLDCMAGVLMGFHRPNFSKPNTEFNRATLTLH
jgi:hypothetical protein